MDVDALAKTGAADTQDDPASQRFLKWNSGLHFYHWVIIVASLLLSVIVWRFTEQSHDRQIETRFNREAERTVALVEERMRHYEDALLSGVAAVNTLGGDATVEQWEVYANSLDLATKYPGINGIGVIHSVERADVDDYLRKQQERRPDFTIHPDHDGNQLYPITYVFPVEGNEKAIGLDIAHEQNRLRAANESRISGDAKITGPITLVQDNQKTPGFLFYAPFYRDHDPGLDQNGDSRSDNLTGFVYAPFVVRKLMKGTLEKSSRHVGIRLSDGDEILYDENVPSESDFDEDPLLKREIAVDFFGREWKFDIWTTNKFRAASFGTQPLLILLAGIIIDGLLIYLFVAMNRASKKSLSLAQETSRQLVLNEKMTEQLKKGSLALAESQRQTLLRAKQLEQSNAELEQFACVASHDLQEPLRKVATFCDLLGKQYADKLDEKGRVYIGYATDGANRMRQLINDLLEFSRVGAMEIDESTYCVQESLDDALANLNEAITASNAEITQDVMPEVVGCSSQMSRLLQNLVGNGLKYRSELSPKIHIGVESDADNHTFSVHDNGIGIDPKYHRQIFGIFKRLHNSSEYEGTGIGLAICQRIVDSWGGKIWVDSNVDSGTRICFTVANQKKSDPV